MDWEQKGFLCNLVKNRMKLSLSNSQDDTNLQYLKRKVTSLWTISTYFLKMKKI